MRRHASTTSSAAPSLIKNTMPIIPQPAQEAVAVGLRNDSERAFAAREQVDPVHAGRQRISGGVLGGVGQRQLRHIEIDFVAAMHLEGPRGRPSAPLAGRETRRRVLP